MWQKGHCENLLMFGNDPLLAMLASTLVRSGRFFAGHIIFRIGIPITKQIIEI
jgi:hypothetical protein